MTWTEERIRDLKRLWAEGRTGAQIAQAMGGISRSAVIGKLYRLNVLSAKRQAPSARLKPRKARPKPVRPKAKPIDRIAIAPVPFVATGAGRCKWIVGDDAPWLTCNNEADGKTYCRGHAAMAYLPPEPLPEKTIAWLARR